MLQKLKKPEYYFQPERVLNKLIGNYRAASTQVNTPWMSGFEINPIDAIGRAIKESGVYDLALTELLWCLISPGDSVIDIGANIGYTTSICSLRSGASGAVMAFEPNPIVLERLKRNIQNFKYANVRLYDMGLSDKEGMASLLLPQHFDGNEGVAFIGDEDGKMRSFTVALKRLDDLIDDKREIQVIKIDVEGHELNVFLGSERLLSAGCIHHIIFEDHLIYPSAVSLLLMRYGYTIFRIEKGWLNVNLESPMSSSTVSSWEAVNYIATLHPAELKKKVLGRFYKCLTI